MVLLQFLSLAAGLLAASATLSAQAVFEGRITMSMKEGSSKPMAMGYAMKKDRIRVDVTTDKGDTVVSIMDFSKKEIISLMPSERMYMVMPMQDVAEAAKEVASESAPLEKTDETEVILGYTCTKYLTRDRNSETEIWATEGIGMFAGVGSSNPMKPAPRHAWKEELAAKGFFPLRVVGKNRRGREQYRLEVTAIDRQALADSLFSPPEGYERFDRGGMLKGALKGVLPFGR